MKEGKKTEPLFFPPRHLPPPRPPLPSSPKDEDYDIKSLEQDVASATRYFGWRKSRKRRVHGHSLSCDTRRGKGVRETERERVRGRGKDRQRGRAALNNKHPCKIPRKKKTAHLNKIARR